LGGKRHVCAGLRRLAGQRSAEIIQTFSDATSVCAPGADRAAQNAKIKIRKNRIFEIAKLKNQKT
jgi:hypothetical protein